MAVAAIEAVETDVVFVAEGNRLRADHVLPGHVRRPGNRETAANKERGARGDRQQGDAQGRICVGMEELRHDSA